MKKIFNEGVSLNGLEVRNNSQPPSLLSKTKAPLFSWKTLVAASGKELKGVTVKNDLIHLAYSPHSTRNLQDIQKKSIHINFWDDFGDNLETYAYVDENEKNVNHDSQKLILDILLEYMTQNFDTEGVKMWMSHYESKKEYPHAPFHFNRWEIKFQGLSHKKLAAWITKFNQIRLFIGGIHIIVYSES